MSNKPPVGANADPNGDVELLVGGEGNITTIKMASKVLSSASPVFAALFEPHFSEGLALSKSSTSSICQIKLPDDNPEALTLVCHVLHYRGDIPHRISLELLEKVAILCDKYDLAIALMPWSEVWLHQIDGQGEAHWAKMLCLASIFANHRAFHLNSQELLSACISEPLPRKRKRGITDGETNPHKLILSRANAQAIYNIASLPDRLFGESTFPPSAMTILIARKAGIYHLRGVVKVNLHQAIEEITAPYVEIGDSAKEVYHFIERLDLIGLWPLCKKFQSLTLQTIIIRLQKFHQSRGTDDCGCSQHIFEDELTDAVDEAEAKIKGLCLECVRHGRATFFEGNCAAASVALCTGESS